MSRNLTAGAINQITSSELQPFLLFQGEFISGTVRAWSGIGDISWNGYTWTGTGTLISISPIQETAETSANGATVTLNGLPLEMISLALGECKQGASGFVYLGFLSNNSVVADPILLFEGRLDIPSIEEGAEAASVTISYESRLIDLERPREGRYTNEDQQREFPGDLGCEFVPALQDLSLTWGRSTSGGATGPTWSWNKQPL